MSSKTFALANILTCPSWMPSCVQYETLMGSHAYNVATKDSDIDIYGFCIPPKEVVFPYLNGEIEGFGTALPRFNQYESHHIPDKDGSVDIVIYSIVKYFHLVMNNNPNMIDSLFTNMDNVCYATDIAKNIKSRRKEFLHTGSYHKFRGYAHAQIKRMRGMSRINPRRKKSIDTYGYDVKFAYHVVRLLLECEDILRTHDLNLSKNANILRAIRNGEWEFSYFEKWVEDKLKVIDSLYETTTLRTHPDEKVIKALLLDSMEEYYGNI